MTGDRPLRVSIALATYNGEQFLAQQLQSFLAQTRLPDELVVGDDNSRDGTARILAEFAANAPFPVRVQVNAPGLGPGRNFAVTIARCTGDVVFLSDQDDVWHPDKIAQMVDFMAGRTGCLVALHDAALIDGEGRPLGRTMGQQIAASGAAPEIGLIAGCCMAFDGRLARLYDPPPQTQIHDSWLTSIADAFGARAWLDRPLIDYRRHGSNVSASYMYAARPVSRWHRLADRLSRARARPAGEALAANVAQQQSALDAIARHRELLAGMIPAERLRAGVAELERKQQRDRRRLEVHRAPRRKRPGLLLKGLAAGDYAGSAGLISLLRDLADAWRR